MDDEVAVVVLRLLEVKVACVVSGDRVVIIREGTYTAQTRRIWFWDNF
jgi:hypothetical protein